MNNFEAQPKPSGLDSMRNELEEKIRSREQEYAKEILEIRAKINENSLSQEEIQEMNSRIEELKEKIAECKELLHKKFEEDAKKTEMAA